MTKHLYAKFQSYWMLCSIVCLLNLYGCTMASNSNSNGRDDYTRIDTVYIRSNDGALSVDQTPIKGRIRSFVLSSIGDLAAFKQGEQVEIITSNIDFSQNTIQTTTDKSSNEVIMKVVSLNDTRVYLSRKCDVVEIFNVSQLPQIEIASGLSAEQIVITPRFDNDCNQIGYQIRYGSEENGCGKQAEKVLQDFRKCTTSTTQVQKRRSTSSCLRALFGVPCK